MRKNFESEYEESMAVAASAKAALDEISDTVEDEEISELVNEAYEVIYDLEDNINGAEEEEEELGFITNLDKLTRETFESPLDAAEHAYRAAKALIEVTGANIYDNAFYELVNALKAKAAC